MQRGWDDVAAGAELVPPNEGGDGAGPGGRWRMSQNG